MVRRFIEKESSVKFLRFLRRYTWWWGTAIVTFFVVFGPYWIWNIAGGSRGWSAFLRFPVTPDTVFDSYLYFQLISLLFAGIDTGVFGPFTNALLLLIRLMPGASVPEIWIVSRYITTVLALWIGAWCIQRVSAASKTVSRWLIACFWLSFLLAIGLRPGVYSWYLPFGMLGFGLVVLSERALITGMYFRWIALGILALPILLVYPWFFLFGGTVLLTTVLVHVIPTHGKLIYSLLTLATLAVCAYAVLLVTGTLAFQVPASFLYFERAGIGFASIPLISNTIIASVLWLGLLRTRRDAGQLSQWWIVLLALWLSPPLIGVDFLNDHFIIVAAIMSWITLAAFAEPSHLAVESTPKDRRIALIIALFSSLFFFYIFQKAFRHIGKFDPYLIHLSVWLALSSAAWFRFLEASDASLERVWRRGRWILLGIVILLGSLGLHAVIRRGLSQLRELRSHIIDIEWIRENVPTDQTVCADSRTAKIIAAHIGRLTFPTVANLILPETDEFQLSRLKVVGAAYDVVAAGDEQQYPFLINGVRTAACDQYAKPADLLSRIGLSRETVNRLIGCHAERAGAFQENVMTSIRAKQVDVDAFRAYCPWVVIPDSHRAFWTLPGQYEEIRVSNDISIWHIR